MSISKLAQDYNHCRRPYVSYKNARSAFRAFLQALHCTSSDLVLLPSFIGWSAREGSGVFDPVTELGLACRFYRMDERLTIDLDHLRELFKAGHVKVLVLIHYFGYVDPCCREAVALAREYGAFVLEDEAHAMFTDLVGGVSGRLGDAAIFSLHKMLPLPEGGLLIANRSSGFELDGITSDGERITLPWEYDLKAIAARRVAHAGHLSDLLEPHGDLLEPLRRELAPGEVPQTFPVLIQAVSRDTLYQRMNDAGYGVVTLYHTMIGQISHAEFPESHALSRRILNLPVHQDTDLAALGRMVETLVAEIRRMKSAE
ncbi:MAG: DegT/DnrJ/EryC1/StrS aminotransferase family protein [Geobacteraceae bacterium]|nr:DegT/DnrJ/EryC1/StrS aminotransferase family protein [Geobacteraceae bacterium]